MPKFFTKWIRPMNDDEIGCDEILVERAGYIPAKKQVEALMYSGQNLRAVRMEMFDGENDNEAEENYDITRDPEFDLSDYTRIMSEFEKKSSRSGNTGSETERTSETMLESETTEEA